MPERRDVRVWPLMADGLSCYIHERLWSCCVGVALLYVKSQKHSNFHICNVYQLRAINPKLIKWLQYCGFKCGVFAFFASCHFIGISNMFNFLTKKQTCDLQTALPLWLTQCEITWTSSVFPAEYANKCFCQVVVRTPSVNILINGTLISFFSFQELKYLFLKSFWRFNTDLSCVIHQKVVFIS